jgi:hypothetical protein
MELINVVIAKSVWLFSLEELNPRGVRLNPTISAALKDRYDFQNQTDKTPATVNLNNGGFKADGVEVAVSLKIYSDGFIGETSASTETSDAFLHDVLTWSADQFGLNYHPGLVKKRMYSSEIVVHADVALTDACGRLISFLADLSNVFGHHPQQVTGFSFGADGQTAMPSFSFERRESVPFSENRYYSRAALQTDAHLALLNQFEAVIGTKALNDQP